MTVYDMIKEMSLEELTEFLYRFGRDVINNFGNFIMPSKEAIENLLQKEIQA